MNFTAGNSIRRAPFGIHGIPIYLGDVISYLGLCLISGTWVVLFIPVVTLAGFVFVSIPALDLHLRRRYGDSFDEYAKETAKLVPFVY